MRTQIKFHSGSIVSSVTDAGPWHVEARDLGKLRGALGDDLLIPFAALFIWADRLTSIAQLMHLNSLAENVPKGSVAAGRNNATLVAYAVGVLFEASHALRCLRKAGIRAIVPHSTHWLNLDALRKRWRDTLPLKDLRNQVAFHADEEKIRAGLDRLIRRRRRLMLMRGDGPKRAHTHHALGPELILAGLRYSRRDLIRVCEQIAADHGAFGELVDGLLIDVMNAKGLMLPL